MAKTDLPPLDRQTTRAVDQLALSQYGMTGLVLMENAGRGCAELLMQLGIDGPVVICCGKGNNGGDGLVVARHLDAEGFLPKVLVCGDPQDLQGDARTNYEILCRTSVPIVAMAGDSLDLDLVQQHLPDADWIVDALLGTGAHGDPRPPLDSLIARLNDAPAKRLAIDLPSGLDCDSGEPGNPTFQADHTCTFVAEKVGFSAAAAKPYVGQLHVVGIGVPRALLEGLVSGDW